MDTQPVAILEKTIGNTIYIVEYTVSDCAKETAYEKVKNSFSTTQKAIRISRFREPNVLDFRAV